AVFIFKQKTAYEMSWLLEFRRVLFRSWGEPPSPTSIPPGCAFRPSGSGAGRRIRAGWRWGWAAHPRTAPSGAGPKGPGPVSRRGGRETGGQAEAAARRGIARHA